MKVCLHPKTLTKKKRMYTKCIGEMLSLVLSNSFYSRLCLFDHHQMRSCNQPVLNYEGKVSCKENNNI